MIGPKMLSLHTYIYACIVYYISTGSVMVSLLSPGIPPLSLQDILDSAGRLVDKHLQDDTSYLDLVDLLNIPGERQ